MNDTGEHVLVVDDENTIRDLLKQLLELNNYRVTTASNGQEALEIYKTTGATIDLVITDLGLPIMNGRQLGEAIKAINPNAKMLIATGFVNQDEYATLMEIGFLEIIRKPFDIRNILEVVKKTLS